MKHLLLTTIAAGVLVGCGKSQSPEPSNESVQLKETIVNKKIHFSLNSNLNAKFSAAFNGEGIVKHSARPDGKYHVEGLEIKIKDAENVRLVFDEHKISEGDTFKAYSDSQPSVLEFTINKVEELKAEVKAPDISFHEAAVMGNIEAVNQHLDAGTDVEVKDNNGFTPLHIATREVAELLIAKGADVNAIVASGQYQGKTPLDAAIQVGRPEVADLLRKHGGKTGEELKAAGN